MDYKEKYEQALKRASKLRVQNPFDTVGQMVEHIFPELKESEGEDEEVKKALITILKSDFEKDTTIFGISVEQIIAWVENQNKTFNVDLLTNVLRKHLYTCVNKTNTYVRSEEDHITLSELTNKIRADLIID